MINKKELDHVLQEISARWGIPGLGVGIVEDGAIVYARGFGVQSLETGVPVTPDSFFCVASITKCFVATAVMQLVEQGRLHLDTPLVRYLPDFRLADERYTHITLRQMLSHTSGMPDMDENEYDDLVANPAHDEGAAERYVRALADRNMVAAPGERFAYSNIAYNVLGYLIATVSGQTFEDTIEEHILRPAGMPESTCFFPSVPTDRLAMPHLRAPGMIVNPVYPYHRADAPASFLHSTVREMCHWAIACLKRGIYQERRILTPASYDQMWTPVTRRDDPPFREEMGLGWTLGHFAGARTVGHGGGGFGWTCFLALLPEHNCAAIVLSNEESTAHAPPGARHPA
jgi:CubicO group peptidase (beta-lactamase class C family)